MQMTYIDMSGLSVQVASEDPFVNGEFGMYMSTGLQEGRNVPGYQQVQFVPYAFTYVYYLTDLPLSNLNRSLARRNISRYTKGFVIRLVLYQ
jgi:hypothetical protein